MLNICVQSVKQCTELHLVPSFILILCETKIFITYFVWPLSHDLLNFRLHFSLFTIMMIDGTRKKGNGGKGKEDRSGGEERRDKGEGEEGRGRGRDGKLRERVRGEKERKGAEAVELWYRFGRNLSAFGSENNGCSLTLCPALSCSLFSSALFSYVRLLGSWRNDLDE